MSVERTALKTARFDLLIQPTITRNQNKYILVTLEWNGLIVTKGTTVFNPFYPDVPFLRKYKDGTFG